MAGTIRLLAPPTRLIHCTMLMTRYMMMRGQFSWRRRKKLRKPSDQMGSLSKKATSTKKMIGAYALLWH